MEVFITSPPYLIYNGVALNFIDFSDSFKSCDADRAFRKLYFGFLFDTMSGGDLESNDFVSTDV